MSTPVTAVPYKKVEKAATAAAAPKTAAEVKKPPPSMDEQLADIERKLSAKKAGPVVVSSGPGLVISTKMREKMQREQEERELRDLENAINEEIRYGASNIQVVISKMRVGISNIHVVSINKLYRVGLCCTKSYYVFYACHNSTFCK